MALNGALWMTTHEGKMKGINSIGTSCIGNPFCEERRKNGNSVCSKCYAATYMKMRKSLKMHLTENADKLTNRILDENELPVINSQVFRLESFGDLHNTIHLKNYISICKHNPGTRFALWTKNIWILDDVFNKEGIDKPANLFIIVSSPLLNRVIEIDRTIHWYIDHVFTVYDKGYIRENNVQINCGAKSCLKCQLCYKNNSDFYVNEQLK